eukprot:Awhi_evm2s14048
MKNSHSWYIWKDKGTPYGSNPFFQQKRDAVGKMGISVDLKLTYACAFKFGMLTYALPADALCENLCMSTSETTCNKTLTLREFCLSFVKEFKREYLKVLLPRDNFSLS